MALKPTIRFLEKAHSVPATKLRYLEVERKFLPTTSSISLLHTNAGTPPFRSHRYIGRSRSHDVYFDKGGLLMRAGIYLRQRNGTWEAKDRLGGNYKNSQFEEKTDVQEIQVLARSILDGERGRRDGLVFDFKAELDPVAEFKTVREEWEVDGGIKVVLDEADFGCVVGEVEICESMKREEMQDKVPVLNERIDGFMKKYEWAFPRDGEVVGKLEAWFRWKEKNLGLKMEASLR
ncbi:CYTH-like domain-containing protein [Dendryphion nanum]|uniref:CYTH-like domain-containing protein n=1 Tax=Dendryphion nanum TaxID=256645 RepID=A0A9P9DNA5_9PLEO|nr:CYTH-like domain-containing protein [Dendryphion nanum]